MKEFYFYYKMQPAT